MRKVSLLPVSVLVTCVLCIGLSACSSGPQVPQPIEELVSHYYQALERHAYDEIFDHYVSEFNLTIDGQGCFSSQIPPPLLRSYCEGLLSKTDTTEGDVGSYSIAQYTQDNDTEAKATIQVTRNGKTYQERLGFIKVNQQWLIESIDDR